MSRWFVIKIDHSNLLTYVRHVCMTCTMCLSGCREGNVRLIGGLGDTEGTVEVCYDKVWGLISANDWDDNDASVVCSQIGYLRDG